MATRKTVWVANDGTEFSSKVDANTHDNPDSFKCLKCAGTGTNTIQRNMYPSGLPDSGWVDDFKPVQIQCDVCNGKGFTECELEPIYQIIGYQRVTTPK